jgi:hypothetical protein
MTVNDNERGAALLTVLLLVAVMATVAATALDRVAGDAAVGNAPAVLRRCSPGSPAPSHRHEPNRTARRAFDA